MRNLFSLLRLLCLVLGLILTQLYMPQVLADATNCPYTGDKLGPAHCEKFGDISVLKFETKGKPLAHIVCVHGLGLCAKAYIPFAKKMTKAGFKTCSVDVKGFGAGRRIEGQKLDLQESLDEITGILKHIRKTEPGIKTILLGESMGGAIAIAVASDHPELVDGIICSAPAWKVYKKKRTAAKGIVDLVLTRPGPGARSLMRQATSSHKLREHWRKDHDHTLDLSAGEILSFVHFMAKTKERAARLEVPVLLIHGLEDRLIKPEGTAVLFKMIKSQKKCLLLYDKGEHIILEEGQFDDTIIGAIEKWIRGCQCPVPGESHTNAVVLINREDFDDSQKQRVEHIFKCAGFTESSVESSLKEADKKTKLIVVDSDKMENSNVEMDKQAMNYFVMRLKPGDDLYQGIKSYIKESSIAAGAIVTIVGSLNHAKLRFAGQEKATELIGPLEIVSAEGTMGEGSCHIHLSVSGSDGKTTGGHLVPGCIVNTTAEIVIVDLSSKWKFDRKDCKLSGYPELDPVSKD